jgi:hypothetical protein
MTSLRVGALSLLALGTAFSFGTALGCAPSEAEFEPVDPGSSVIPDPEPAPDPKPSGGSPSSGGATATGGSSQSGGSTPSGGSPAQGGADDEPSAGQPGMDPPDEPDPCSNVSCALGQHCEAGKCVPDVVVDPCAVILCATGTHCEEGECVPNGRVICGGIAGFECPGAGECVDDPSDDCHPDSGGADCGGVCLCAAEGVCKRGQIWNSSPGVCACESAKGAAECGDVKCGPGQYCCNASCSLCVAEGEGCLDVACL